MRMALIAVLLILFLFLRSLLRNEEERLLGGRNGDGVCMMAGDLAVGGAIAESPKRKDIENTSI